MRAMRSTWSALAIGAVIWCASAALAVDGIAVSARRGVDGDPCFGVGRMMFGDLVRHDITGGRTVKSTVIYKGKARAARISFKGDKVAFLKLDGRICVVNMDGRGFKELAKAKNHNGTAMDWPKGDWVYYTQPGPPPPGGWKQIVDTGKGGWGQRVKQQLRDQRTIRRINVVTGADEPVGNASHTVWQLSLSACATKGRGRYAITGALLNFSNPPRSLNRRGLPCGVAVSPSGHFVCEMDQSHADLIISDWDLKAVVKRFHVNEWNKAAGDSRKYFYRPRWSVNSDKWIVLTQGTNSNATIDTNMVVYNWIDGKQIQVTGNAVGVKQNDEGEDFWLAGTTDEFTPEGFTLEGEAPFTVDIEPLELSGSRWLWDFGDKAKAKSPTGKHTYTKGGLYTVTARYGDKVFRRSVKVSPRRPPRGEVFVTDPTHLIVRFDEPVRAAAGRTVKVTLASGAKASFRFERAATWLMIGLDKPVAPADTLALQGITDRAQAPNALANPKLAVRSPAWPSNPNGLMFLWETATRPRVYLSAPRPGRPGKSAYRPVKAVELGRTAPDRFGTVVFSGGAIYTPGAHTGVVYGCRKTNRFTIEATIVPAAKQAKPNAGALLVSSNWHMGGWSGGNFALYQKAGRLIFNVRNKTASTKAAGGRITSVDLCPISTGTRSHVVLTLAPGDLRCYLNGKQVARSEQVKGLLTWEPPGVHPGLHFGGFGGGQKDINAPWRGTMEGVAIYNRALPPGEVAANFAAYKARLKARKYPQRLEIRAKLLAKTPIPRPAEIVPYVNAMVVFEYQVLDVIKGAYKPKAKKIRVARWGLIGLRRTDAARAEIGSREKLVVEAFADHPELQGQLVKNALGDNFDLPLHVIVKDTNPPDQPFTE